MLVVNFTVLQLSYGWEKEEDRPHLIQTERVKEPGGGKGAATGYIYNFF